MNKRFCKLGKYAAKAFFLFAVCGATYSCTDDYMWDDSDPTWLGSSIYEYLQEQGNYKNFVNLIDDLDYKEVLGRTGSKTLFVADDDAFKAFYQSNPWGVSSYEQLSKSQKKLLLNSAMINNAYLLEMMSSTPAPGGDNALPEKGECLRRETAVDITDSVPHFTADELPITYNKDDKDYWARFRNPEKNGIYLALDATAPMMTHFLPAQMQKKFITNEDFEIMVRQQRNENDAYIYDCKVLEQDITCQNGYLNKLDKVLLTPQNMAEVLRTNSSTKIFSHMMDRFSAPFYNQNLTERYRLLYGNEVDSVYQKRYFSKRSQGDNELLTDAGTDPVGNPTGNKVNFSLNFDPGWNTYKSDNRTAKEVDMAVIFAPTDQKFLDYFFSPTGGGRFLIEAYAHELQNKITENTTDYALIYEAIDQIPLNVIQALINNLMKESFVGSVPSKFETIKNDAQDPMLDETHIPNIVDVKFANNGAIFLMNEVITPAQYAAVSAPAYVATDMHLFNWAIQQAQLGGINSNYYAYLLAMSSRFSFFVPQDVDYWYIDPISFYRPTLEGSKLQGRALYYTWNESKSEPAVASHICTYDLATGEIAIDKTQAQSRETVTATVYGNRLKDMLETHTIIHEDNTDITGNDETETGVECNQHYFVSKNGSVIYVENATNRDKGMTVKGGWQIDNDDACQVIRFDDKSRQSNGNGNGYAYEINTPLVPTIESVYSAMYKNPNFKKFFELCQTDMDVLKEIGITKATEQNKYTIFTDNKGLPCYGKREDGTFAQISSATNVRFFNNYRYTVYVPTNSAMEAAEAKGLPTWQDIRDLLELDLDDDQKTELTQSEQDARNEKAKAMATAIVNFVKYHFQDNSVFADTPSYKATQYETATINSETGVYCKVTALSEGNGNLKVKDIAGNTRSITSDKNIIVRDYITNGKENAYENTLISSSAAVVHGIDGVLDYKTYANGRYDSDWTSQSRARAYLKKYQLLK